MALCTPDFFGFNADLKLQYRGRLNSAGKNQTSSETKNDLVDAMLLISKNGIRPEEQIPSIGKQTITSLLRKFKSAKRVQKASLKELQEIVGDSRAKTIYQYFKKDE